MSSPEAGGPGGEDAPSEADSKSNDGEESRLARLRRRLRPRRSEPTAPESPPEEPDAPAPKPLFSLKGFVAETEHRSFQPEPGGRTFIMVQRAESKAQPQVVLVLNWFGELEAKVGAKR